MIVFGGRVGELDYAPSRLRVVKGFPVGRIDCTDRHVGGGFIEIAGVTAPPGKKMGHAGAIVSRGKGTAEAKMSALRKAGAEVGENPTEAGELMAAVVAAL